jgi:hypothetical protein
MKRISTPKTKTKLNWVSLLRITLIKEDKINCDQRFEKNRFVVN